MTQSATIAMQSDAHIHTIPGSAFHQDRYGVDHYYLFKSGKASSFGNLENGDFCKREAKVMYEYLVTHTPAGIFKEFFLEMLKSDATCNNYIKEIL